MAKIHIYPLPGGGVIGIKRGIFSKYSNRSHCLPEVLSDLFLGQCHHLPELLSLGLHLIY